MLRAHQFLFHAAVLETKHCREQFDEDALKFLFFGKTKFQNQNHTLKSCQDRQMFLQQ